MLVIAGGEGDERGDGFDETAAIIWSAAASKAAADDATAATNAAFTDAASRNGRSEKGAGGGLAVLAAAAVKP